jgi:protein-tyrosine phosphatase
MKGTRNLRDLGGYPTVDGRRTRWRTLFRSDCLDQLDDAGQAWLINAGLRTIIDLRDDEEVTTNPNVFAGSGRVSYRRMPFFDGRLPPDLVPDLSQGYRRELDLRGERLREIFEAVAEPGALPVLIHCAAGKDRTGIVVGLLLAAAGVSREIIGQDYALSEQCLGPEYLVESRAWIARQGLDWESWAHLFVTPPERMEMTLDYVDQRWGGTEAYLLAHDLAPGRFDLCREMLTEASSAECRVA